MKKVLITQSNYIPWKGFFDANLAVDVLVLFDDMQYTKNDWRNRNLIKSRDGLKWLTIPCNIKSLHQKINETLIADTKWNIKHWKTIYQNYIKAPYFKEYMDIFEVAYLSSNKKYLSEVNYDFIVLLFDLLGITTEIKWSSEFELLKDRNERLVNICKQLDATDYYTGPAAKSYMNKSLFRQEGIRVHFFNYSGYPEYSQLFPPFEHRVSIIDLIFNCGKDSLKYMQGNK